MGRPSKSTDVLKNEKKSHRTKAELNQRANAEAAALTGIKIRESAEVKANPVAHKEFARVKKLLNAAGKNDALYEAVINDYCMYKADIDRYTKMRQELEQLPATDSKYKMIMSCDDKIDKFKKKRFDIEKENGMTIASSLRAIPKKVTQVTNPLMDLLNDE